MVHVQEMVFDIQEVGLYHQAGKYDCAIWPFIFAVQSEGLFQLPLL